ncbi:MAG: hypothetical protein HKP27_13385 [Myxococcales bacterium]|nr:hypothetical protein [Myxococcales bacterium]
MDAPKLSGRLLRAALLAALYPALAMASPFGTRVTLTLFVAAAAAFWAAAEGRGLRERIGAGFLALLLSSGGALALGELTGAVAGAAVALAGLRRKNEGLRLRSVAIEGAIATLALLLFRWLAGPAPLASAAAIWGFFLVQCGGVLALSRPETSAPARDAFREARERLDALLRES